MIVVHKEYKLVNLIESLFRLYLPITLVPVALRVLKQLPYDQEFIFFSLIAAVFLFLLFSYCCHNIIQGYKLLSTGKYKKIKFVSLIATIIGLIYCWNRIKTFLSELEINGLSSYSIYLLLFLLLLLLNLYRDISIIRN